MSQSIGSFARNIIATQPTLTNQEVLDLVKGEFPNAKTSINCIAWYKSNMKKTKYQVQPVVVERTLEVIQGEIDATEAKLEELKLELELKVEETRETMEAQFKALAEKLGYELPKQDEATA